MKRVAYLTGRAWRKTPMAPGTLPWIEGDDFKLVSNAGGPRGLSFEVRYWDEPDLAEQGFDAAIVRSTWDYIERCDEFIATLRGHERAGLRLFNRADVIGWNARKTYLDDLGALAIPTLWAEKLDSRAVAQAFDTLDAAELVIKPQIGGGSRETIKLKRNAWSEADLRDGPRSAAMLQPFLASVETEGEHSLFWFGGEFSHAIRKAPRTGWFANDPAATDFAQETPPRAALEVAEAARALAPKDLLYVRIDVVRADDGGWRVIEIEAIEPYLFLVFAPAGAEVFAGAIARVLEG
ncbi:MAG TPA: transporter [Caulobacterales bacterium]|nr:transporter [Caulobacterales bacterium]